MCCPLSVRRGGHVLHIAPLNNRKHFPTSLIIFYQANHNVGVTSSKDLWPNRQQMRTDGWEVWLDTTRLPFTSSEVTEHDPHLCCRRRNTENTNTCRVTVNSPTFQGIQSENVLFVSFFLKTFCENNNKNLRGDKHGFNIFSFCCIRQVLNCNSISGDIIILIIYNKMEHCWTSGKRINKPSR